MGNTYVSGLRKTNFIIGSVIASLFLPQSPTNANDVISAKKFIRPVAYSIEMTDPPCLQPRSSIGELSAIDRFSKQDVLVMSGHRRDARDNSLQLTLLAKILNAVSRNKRALAIGLSFIPATEFNRQKFKSYLDSAAGKQISFLTTHSDDNHSPKLRRFRRACPFSAIRIH